MLVEDEIKFDESRVVGLKLQYKPGLIKPDQSMKDFLKDKFVNFSIITVSEENNLTLKWYDEHTGEAYLHFDTPIPVEALDIWFPKEKMIFEIKENRL